MKCRFVASSSSYRRKPVSRLNLDFILDSGLRRNDGMRQLCHSGESRHIAAAMLIARDKSQLLIVDVQDKLLDAISGKDRAAERCGRLGRAARLPGVPITLSEQYPQ